MCKLSVEGGARRSELLVVGNQRRGANGKTHDEQKPLSSSTTRQFSFYCAFNVSTADPFIDPDAPHYCQRYAWSGTFTGNLIGGLSGICVFTGLPLILGANPKFFMLDV